MGAANLRDGVTVLPATDSHRARLVGIIEQVESAGGASWLFEFDGQPPDMDRRLAALFDRREAYDALMASVAALQAEIGHLDEVPVRRRLRQIEREHTSIADIDFSPGATRVQADRALDALIAAINRRFSPAEPSRDGGEIQRLDRVHFQSRRWATRKRLWVDRMASAWLIRRFIDADARFLWLERLEDCPEDALGFDFDGAVFTHVGERVSFEVLLASFGLEDESGLTRIGQLVHYLDVGGVSVAEAAGFEAVLAGLRENTADDDALLQAGIDAGTGRTSPPAFQTPEPDGLTNLQDTQRGEHDVN